MPDLIEMLGDQEPLARAEAAEKLAVLGSTAKYAVPVLITVLDDTDADVRGAAAIALGRIGPDAHDAVDKLIGLLEDPMELVRWAALLGLGTYRACGSCGHPRFDRGAAEVPRPNAVCGC